MDTERITVRKDRKKRIGIMVGNYHSDHPRRLVKRIWELLGAKGMEARFYLGTESSSFLTNIIDISSNFDYQYASLYGACWFDDLDALIISAGTLCIYQGQMTVNWLLDMLPDIPIILLENDRQSKSSTWVIIDNYQGIATCVEHLATEHGLRKILFIKGPDGNCDSDERLEGYLAAMKKLGLPVTDSMIGNGDFSENVDAVVEKLLDENPDAEAIVSANDEMCISIYRVCEKRGLVIGKDIAVTGFDNAEMSRYMDPPLTTVEQNYETFSQEAVEMLMSILDGQKPECVRIPVPFIHRASCGSIMSSSSSGGNDYAIGMEELRRTRRQREDFQHEVWIGSLLMRELLMETADMKKFLESLGACLSYLKVSNSYIGLIEKSRTLDIGETPTLPRNYKLYLVQQGDKYTAYDDETAPLFTRHGEGGGASNLVPPGMYMTFLLFYEKYQYGTLNVEIDPGRIDFFYMLSLEIGSSIRHLQMSIEQERYKAELQTLARHDNLTGLYNRLGLVGTVAGFVKTNGNKKLVALMADLDHLKQINDTFGHSAGDAAIIQSAEILRKSLGKAAPLGRTGGDEYMAVFVAKDGKAVEKIERKIKEACRKYNEKSEKPYYVELSVGCNVFEAFDYTDLNSVMEQADRNLYEAKKSRRESVIRNC